MSAAATVLICGALTMTALVVAGRQLAHLEQRDHELDERDLELAACDHAHTRYVGDTIVDYSDGRRWLEGTAPVDRCMRCDAELVGKVRRP